MLFLIIREINDITNSKIFAWWCIALRPFGIFLWLITIITNRSWSQYTSILLKAYVRHSQYDWLLFFKRQFLRNFADFNSLNFDPWWNLFYHVVKIQVQNLAYFGFLQVQLWWSFFFWPLLWIFPRFAPARSLGSACFFTRPSTDWWFLSLGWCCASCLRSIILIAWSGSHTAQIAISCCPAVHRPLLPVAGTCFILKWFGVNVILAAFVLLPTGASVFLLGLLVATSFGWNWRTMWCRATLGAGATVLSSTTRLSSALWLWLYVLWSFVFRSILSSLLAVITLTRHPRSTISIAYLISAGRLSCDQKTNWC